MTNSDMELLWENPWIAHTSAREIARRLGICRRRAAYLKGRSEGRIEHGRRTRRRQEGLANILVVGDAHFEPGQDMSRAAWLGRFIAQNLGQDDHVVIIGDWHGLTSICSHNNQRQREGHRLVDDLAAGNDAIDIMMSQIGPLNRPMMYFTTGNHEIRLDRLAQERPEYDGVAGLNLLDWEKHGVEVIPFLEPLRIEGWRFQHYLPHGGGRAIAGVNAPRNMLKRVRHSESVVVGHSHLLQMETSSSRVGGRKWGISVGCYFDHQEVYAGTDSNAAWWAGLVLIENARHGDGSIRCITLDDVQRAYSD